jgi:hypothetical protein
VPLSPDTQLELRAAREYAHLGLEQQEEYFSFLRKWMAFNRAYSELKSDREEWKRVRAVAEDLQPHWSAVSHLAQQVAAMECIGSRKGQGRLLEPDEWGKSAMLYLREYFHLVGVVNVAHCQFGACRAEKKRLCDSVSFTHASLATWRGHEMAALLQLVYQVRCNLVHGGKRLAANDLQTARDLDLIHLSSLILDRVLEWLINGP